MVEVVGEVLLTQALETSWANLKESFKAEETVSKCGGKVVIEAKPAMFRHGLIYAEQARGFDPQDIPKQSMSYLWVRTDPQGFFSWSCDGARQRDRLQADQGINNPTTRNSWGNKDLLLQVFRDRDQSMQLSATMVCPLDQAPTQFSKPSPTVPQYCTATAKYNDMYDAMRSRYMAVMGDD